MSRLGVILGQPHIFVKNKSRLISGKFPLLSRIMWAMTLNKNVLI